ncbi:VCBS repeat-containing protein [Spirosoma sp. RP8]|uniref:VCBS repeat-containing protein n=1 Tax=Spirosoma liriopis TaxID=2937440 RepID=A0ABT0HQR7_9BACT|nr:VCBS repeat-containing protein [Spirosoma liriopis]MCK8494514.1 VCBS repeat-containing protein [Spirosoma liriopis]
MWTSQTLLAAVCFLAGVLWPDTSSDPAPLFTLLSPDETNVRFVNSLTETDSLNIFRYEYLYNGNGVGVGDFNGDGQPDLFFSGNTVPHKLYLNKADRATGRWHFDDVTERAGVAGNGTWATGVSVADVNGDGRLDVYVCHSGKYPAAKLVNELFINEGVTDGVPRFRERAKEFGLDLPGTQSTQSAFFDYDRDGDLDVFVLNHSNHTYNPFLNTRKIRATPDMRFGNRLLRNDANQFTDVTLAEGIVNNPLNFGLGVGVSDLNGDGWPDLYTTSDYTEQDCLYLNQHDGAGHHTGFKESLRTAMTHTSKFSMGCDLADYNNDTLPDVVTLDMLPEDNHRQKMLKGPDEYDSYQMLIDSGYFRQQMRNMLQLNRGSDSRQQVRFSEIGQMAGVASTDWSWSALLADLDNDGWKDLFVTNGYLRDFTDLDFMKYTVAEAKLEEAAKGNLNFQTVDLVRKMPSNRPTNYAFRNNRDLTFSNQSANWGLTIPAVSGAAAYADFDGDGDLDLIVCKQNEPVALYRNNAEKNRSEAHFLRIRLQGKGANTQAVGARIVLETTDGRQLQEAYPVRGYQASVEPTIHFGLGKQATVRRLTVYWPDGQQSQLTNVPADQTLTLGQADASPARSFNNSETALFRPLVMNQLLPYKHRENDFIDFKVEVLIPYELSRLGPALAKADVNADGLEDIFLGGAVGQSGELWLQQTSGTFKRADGQPWQADAASEDVNALFFDADKDGDADLYVASGGNEYEEGSPEYQDRLYLNDGKSGFTRAMQALPPMRSSKLAVAAADMDGDGDLDLFVGGRGKPGSFPLPSPSYLLRNDTPAGGAAQFTDVTDQQAPGLRTIGMVQAAVWTDLHNDKFPELILAGDWMAVRLFDNQNGKLSDNSASAGLADTEGMWASLLAADVDGDGDTDLIAGNAGLNNLFRADAKQPMQITASDIDNDGVVDPLWTYYIQGKAYPVASRDELLDQVVPLRKKFTRYRQYADATVPDILTPKQLGQATIVSVKQLASGVFVNTGNGKFQFEPLPTEAQLSRGSALLWEDLDADGKKDLLVAGNFYPYRVQFGPCSASFGCLLRGDGRGKFQPVAPRQAGIWAGGDVRQVVSVRSAAGRQRLLFTVNDGPLVGFER